MKKKSTFKPTGIRFFPRDHGPAVYLSREDHYSSVRTRGRSLSAYFSDMPLNQQVILRIHAKAHALGSHSPAKVRTIHKNMIDFWHKKGHREGVSCQYINSRTIHRFI